VIECDERAVRGPPIGVDCEVGPTRQAPKRRLFVLVLAGFLVFTFDCILAVFIFPNGRWQLGAGLLGTRQLDVE
jgi:hypothetical protein